ncbi:RNA polymerase sigma factor [Hirschia litorea]|uniref:RNA polymerase sigma factor n=1 Tax=Hirschia litorea TaxID=1199156 RepID=A0ABW2IPG0_9PROT
MRSYISLRPALKKFLRSRLPTDQDAEDCLNDLATRVLTSSNDEERGNLQGYLFAMASNLVADWFRASHTRQIGMHVPIYDLSLANDDLSLEDTLDGKQSYRRFEEGLGKLKQDERHAFELHRVQSKTLSQVADELDVSIARVRKLIKRSHSKLINYVWG